MPKPVKATPAELAARAVLTLADIELLEKVVARVAGLVVKASAVADRSEFLPCLDHWATKERLARIDDVVFNGQRLLQRLSAA